MKLSSASFLPDQPIPEQFAFGAPDSVLHIKLARNFNPHLKWTGAPAQTQSFAIFCVDSEAPTSSEDANQEGRLVAATLPRRDFYHWAIVDIPSTVHEIAAGECSDGIVAGGKKELTGPAGSRQGLNDYTGYFANDPDMAGKYLGYDGPCPPWNDQRIHRYHFTVYALSGKRAAVEDGFTAQDALAAIKPMIIDQATITGTYAIYSKAIYPNP